MIESLVLNSPSYWSEFQLEEEDIEYVYEYLLENETPITSLDILTSLIENRTAKAVKAIEAQYLSGGTAYKPSDAHSVNQDLMFPSFAWSHGVVQETRPGYNPDAGKFDVITVKFDNGDIKDLASNLDDHPLNQEVSSPIDNVPDVAEILHNYGNELLIKIDEDLSAKDDFVRIAGKWFPRALLIDISSGHLNLAEAVLEMMGGGPHPTREIVKDIELKSDENANLLEFSLDLALQEDERFDEVGPAGEILWYLKRLEPEEVLKPPLHLHYVEIDHDRDLLSREMLDLELQLEDELSPAKPIDDKVKEAVVTLLFPHWRTGSLPLPPKVRPLFPTAYEAPRIRFILVDGDSGKKFPGWVIREHNYVYGLKQWFVDNGLIPGSKVFITEGDIPGEVKVSLEKIRSRKEWIRTVLIGSDAGLVYAMLKHNITAGYDDRYAIAIPDEKATDRIWDKNQIKSIPFERIVVNTFRELAKLNQQNHVHAAELYTAINVVRRCPPAPVFSLLASRPWFQHVGDMHYQFDDSEGA